MGSPGFLCPSLDRRIYGYMPRTLRGNVFSRKELDLLCIAFSYTHLYGPGTRHHIKNALKAGATLEEIMEVLKLCVVQGVQACNLVSDSG